MNVSFLQELLNTVAEQSRALLPKALFGPGSEDNLEALARALMSVRGEASGVAIARQLLTQWHTAPAPDRRAFLAYLADELQPDPKNVADAAHAYLEHPGEAALSKLQAACESPRLEFFRRLNLASGATGEIVDLREQLLRTPKSDLNLMAVDADLQKVLTSWFNRGFLVLRRIDWQTPAAILEKIIAYEAVHEIRGWDDLRRRLDPADRRCFAFFHPALVDEPLIFVEVALTSDIPNDIRTLLDAQSAAPAGAPTTAVFYSISNCQEGLRGISFGNFLLKQVVEELAREVPSLKTFVTLSPVPHFARWVDRVVAGGDIPLSETDIAALRLLRDPSWANAGWAEAGSTGGKDVEALKTTLMALAAHYFLLAKSTDNRPVDPVARFHLGNGARLERINWMADLSEKGLREAHGLMVNYRYEPAEIEKNHEAYAQDGAIAASRSVRGLLRPPVKSKSVPLLQSTGQKAAQGTGPDHGGATSNGPGRSPTNGVK